METTEDCNNYLIIAGQRIPVIDCELNQADLRFYPENPRIYSLVCFNGEIPTQETIEERLCEKDHVKNLYHSIRTNEGLIDPLIVKQGDNIVFEGNSRLAAYRLLVREDPVKWGKVRCRVLPKDITSSLIFTLLGQYHIIGRQDWSPFEQAGYLLRRSEKYQISPEVLAKEIGVKINEVRRLINVYSFMRQYGDMLPHRWSYYDEYLKIPAKKRNEHNKLNETVVEQIKTGKIAKAEDIRGKLKKILNNSGKVENKLIRKFIDDEATLNDVFEAFQATGADNDIYKKLKTFREIMLSPDVRENISQMDKSSVSKCIYELKSINKGIDALLKRLNTAPTN